MVTIVLSGGHMGNGQRGTDTGILRGHWCSKSVFTLDGRVCRGSLCASACGYGECLTPHVWWLVWCWLEGVRMGMYVFRFAMRSEREIFSHRCGKSERDRPWDSRTAQQERRAALARLDQLGLLSRPLEPHEVRGALRTPRGLSTRPLRRGMKRAAPSWSLQNIQRAAS